MSVAVSGLELLRVILGMEIEAIEPGRAQFGLRTREEFGNPNGTLHGVITATLLDSAMACAVLSQLPPDVGSTTVDLAVTYLRPVAWHGTRLSGRGEVPHLGRQLAAAHGQVTDDRDRPIATATTTCQILRGDAS